MRVIGYAVPEKKAHKHLTPELVAAAAREGIELRFLSPEVPLEEQGHLDAILHKTRDPVFEKALVEHASANPSVRLVDRPEAIRVLRHRADMLRAMPRTEWVLRRGEEGGEGGRGEQDAGAADASEGGDSAADGRPPPARAAEAVVVRVPRSIVLEEGGSEAEARAALDSARLAPPLLVKPAWSDGRPGSHGLYLLRSWAGLAQVVGADGLTPAVVQEYVPHSGTLFKVYTLGADSCVVRRASLALTPAGLPPALAARGGGDAARGSLVPLRRVSRYPSGAKWGSTDLSETTRCGAGGRRPDTSGDEGGGARPKVPAARSDRGDPPSTDAAADAPPGTDVAADALPSAAAATPEGWLEHGTAAAPPPPGGAGPAPPPRWAVRSLAHRLRRELGIDLFNFDLLVPDPGWEGEAGAPADDLGWAAEVGVPELGRTGGRDDARPTWGGSGTEAATGDLSTPGPGADDVPLPGVPRLDPPSATLSAVVTAPPGSPSSSSEPHTEASSTAGDSPRSASSDPMLHAPPNGLGAAPGRRPRPSSAPLPARPTRTLLLIDANYFPGYEKLPDYNARMLRYFRSLLDASAASAPGK